ncbi:MAG TPA: acyl carrier protein [Acidimicrobiales bacterium]
MDGSLDAIGAAVRVLLAERLHVAPSDVPADAAASLQDIGLDSTAILSLVVGLEDRFDIEIPDLDITVANFGTVAAITRYVADRTAAPQ